MSARPSSKPDLMLAVEVETAEGTLHRLGPETLKRADRPMGVNFRTQRGDGFADAGFSLKRSVLRDYPDLSVGDTTRFIGADGQVLHEGYIASLSRETGDEGHRITIPISGWMSHARDRRFREIYVDRDLNRFTSEPPLPRQIALLTGATKYRLSAGSVAVQADPVDGLPAVRLEITRVADTATNRALAECWYDAGGIPLGRLIGDGYLDKDKADAALAAPFTTMAALADAPVPTDLDSIALTGTAAGFEIAAADPAKPYALLQLAHNATTTTTADGEWNAWFRGLAAYGAHGLTPAGGGFVVSDVIADIARRFCPLFDLSGIQQTTYPLRQIAYHDPTFPHDAFLELNKAHLWELSVWEGRRLCFEPPADLAAFDWQVRTDDPGVRCSFGGDVITEMGNGVEVGFTDLLTGSAQVIGPLDYPDELRDTDPDNPLNRGGREKWLSYDVPFPCLEADAVQYGRAYYAEATRAKSPVSITAGFHIRDAAGNWRPTSEVRCGERIAITDHPNSAPRRIIDTSYTHDGRGLTVSADRASQHLSAIVDRITLARTAASLT